MKLSEEIDEAVSSAISGMSGMYSNAEIRERVSSQWPERLSRVVPTPCRIAKSMSRLGYERWEDRLTRGWII
ncbi:MAG: hypothetical protein EOM91_12440 [Sphingobacteriia bacterium]|nr:hypothetical protein [Sphingobacteriia bacterium]